MTRSDLAAWRGHRLGLALLVSSVLTATTLGAQTPPAGSGDGLWRAVEEPGFPPRTMLPSSFFAASLDEGLLATKLAGAPRQVPGPFPRDTVIALLLPDGTFPDVAVVETRLMEPALAALFPQIKTYAFVGTNDPALTGQFALGPTGFHAIAQHGGQLLRIDPFATASGRVYLGFRDQDRSDGSNVIIHPDDEHPHAPDTPTAVLAPAGPPTGNFSIGDTLRTYRLAAATTGEFFQAREGGFGTLGVLFSLVIDVMGVNAVFEPELGVRLILSLASLDVFYSDPQTDPFVQNDDPNTVAVEGTPCSLRGQNRTNSADNGALDNGDYDLGFLFATQTGGGSAGCAWFNLCREGAGVLHKSAAAGKVGNNGTNSAVGIVLHETGHQLGANHTYSGQAGGCDLPNFSENPAADPTAPPGSAYEPGSGSTIMSYSGICADQPGNPPPPPPPPLQNDNVDLSVLGTESYYHTASFHQILEYLTNGDGSTCGTTEATGNQTPTQVDAGPDYTIPRQTPFTLQGEDAQDDEPLTYVWEQLDLATTRRPIDTDDGLGPIIRSVPPTSDTARTIPHLPDLLANVTRRGEILPQVNRDLNFRYTARDNRMGGGGLEHDEMVVHVAGSPFFLTSPNGGETLFAGCPVPVSWVVGGGAVAASVDIQFSQDAGTSFPETLLAATANDGSAQAPLTCATTAQGRLKAAAVGNIFFDVSDGNFTVVPSPPQASITAAGGSVDNACEFLVTFQGTAQDDCGIAASDVTVSFFKQADNFTLGTPTVNKQQVDATTVAVSGSVLVSNVSDSPAVLAIELDAQDLCGAHSDDIVEIQVVDDTPPTIAVDLEPNTLWPPNHKLIDILANAVAADNCPGVTFSLTSVTSNEPDEGLGDGDFPNDIQGADVGTPDLAFQLRAERSGQGVGRTYTAVYTATDASDNQTQGADAVNVPKSPKK
jgi:hypothetical protein